MAALCPACGPETTDACFPRRYVKDDILPRSRVDTQARINTLLARRSLMTEYLTLKRDEGAWHGVQDAASDLRDIDAELKGLRWVLGEGE